MTVRINGLTRIKSQSLVNFPPAPALNLDFTTPYVNGLNPLSSNVTFSRADAGAYATHVGPDGLVRRAAHNITVPSAPGAGWDFVSFTSSFNTSETTAPDGSSTAAKISNDDSGAAGYHYLRSGVTTTIANNTYVWSGYLKKGTITVVQILCQGTTSQDIWANFDLNAGAIGNKGTATTAYMTSVGNGWYRCSISGTSIANNNSEAVFFSGTNNNSSATRIPQYTGSVSNYFYIWGAQLEQNITPSYYVPTTSAAVYSTPRYDYDPVTLQPKGLLIEEARTNILTRSNEFSATGWTLANATVAQGVLSPDGTTNAWTFSETTTNGVHELYNSMGSAPEPPYSWSIYAKAGTSRYICIWVSSGAVVKVDLQTGTILGVVAGTGFSDTPTSEIYSAGNGWYRIVYHTTRTAAQYNGIPGIGLTNNGNITSGSYNPYAGNTGNNVLIAFGQFEAGSFATSYIPTGGGSVTRAKDVATITGTNFSSWYNADAGTILAVATPQTVDQAALVFAVNTSGNSNQHQILKSNAAISDVGKRWTASSSNSSGTAQALFSSASDVAISRSLLAYTYALNSFNFAHGGLSLTEDTSGTLPSPTVAHIGNKDGSNQINGWIEKIQYWPSRFSNEKLQLITKG